MAPEVMRGQPYDFSVDTYAIGLILRDMIAKVTVIEWFIDRIPENMRPPKKRWPTGQCTIQPFSTKLLQIMNQMTDQNPQGRPSLFAVTQDLWKLAQAHQMPHPFWGADQVICAKGPPARGYTLQTLYTPEQGANIAQKVGIRQGAQVK